LAFPAVSWVYAQMVVDTSLPPVHDGLGRGACPSMRLMGIPCPGCGMGRGLYLLLHYRFEQALLMNPFAYLLMAVFIAFWIASLYQLLSGRPMATQLMERAFWLGEQRWFFWPFMLLIIAVWIWNIDKFIPDSVITP
jgi:hypothetical protein